MALPKISRPFICRFPISATFESQPPSDGSVIFVFNHQNYYDSLVCGKVLDKWRFACLAGDEPRGTIQGLSLEARGVVWIDRSDPDSRKASADTLLALLHAGTYVGWFPEGTWNTTENRLMLPIAHGMARVAIVAAQSVKVYLIPVLMDYEYQDYRVKRASVHVCKAIPVASDMDAIDLTENVETICWTTRWMQLEQRMKRDPGSAKIEDSYVYPRAKLSRTAWKRLVDKLHSQYKVDWSIEESYHIFTKAERLQREMEEYL